MSQPLTMNAMFNLSFGAITRGKEAEREISKHIDAGATEGFKKGLAKSGRKFAKGFEETWASMLQTGMKRAGSQLKKSFDEAKRVQEKLSDNLQEVEEQIEKVKDEGQLARLNKEREELQKRLKIEKKAFEKQLKTAKSEVQSRVKVLQEHEDRVKRSSVEKEKAQEAGETFEGLVQKAMSPDSMDAKGIADSLSKALTGALESGAGAAAGGGMGGVAAGLAGTAAAVGAIAVPLAAIVGVLSQAVSGATDLNKSLMNSATSADIMGDSMVKLTGPLGGEIKGLNLRLMMLRRTTNDVATEFRLSTEEVSEAIGALNQSGLTVREFAGFVGDASSDMDAYAKVTRTAIVASQSLGISASETGDFMNKLQKDMGSHLDDVQGAFGLIYSEAGKAGMSTKDFFSAINEASSGMALYNFRLTDTVGLYSDMVHILGEDLAKEKSKLEGTFRGMGRQERYKTVLTSGAAAGKIVKAEAGASSADFSKKFSSLLGEKGPLARISGENGLDMRKLADMSDKEFRATLHQTRQQDKAAAMQLENLRDLSGGLDGGLTQTADALGALGKGGELALQLSQANAILGKPLSELKGLSAAAFEEITGYSGDQYEVLKRLDRGLRGEFEALQASNDPSVVGKTFEEALTTGLLSQSKELEEAGETQYSLAERAAQDQLHETRSMTQTLQNTIAGFLENIWLGIEEIVRVFTKYLGKGDEGAVATLATRQASFKKEDELSKIAEGIGSEILSKKESLLTEKDTNSRVKLKEEIAALEEQAKTARSRVDGERSFRKELMGGKGEKEARSQVFSETQGMSPEDYMKKMSFSQQQGILGDGGVSVRASEGLERSANYGGLTGSDAIPKLLEDLKSGKTTVDQAKTAGFDVKPMEDLTAAQIEAITDEAEKDREQQTKISDDQAKSDKKQVDATESLVKLIRSEQTAALSAASGMDIGQLSEKMQTEEGKQSIIAAVKAKGDESKGREALATYGLSYGAPVEDFIYRGDGTGSGEITPIDKMDQFFGAKPGGPVAGAMAAGGKGTVIIHINGGDEAKVYAVVKKALKESGYSDMRSY